MVLRMEEYAMLRHEFLKVAKFHIKPVALEELKVCYANAINSARALDRIENIEDLLRILEKRGVVRYNNITPLQHIAKKYLNHSGINVLLDNYEEWLTNNDPRYPPHANLYQIRNGEFFTSNGNLNGLSCPRNVNPKSQSILDHDLSDCNNRAVSVNRIVSNYYFFNGSRDNSDKNNRYNLNTEHKDCNAEILTYRICETDLDKLADNVVLRVSIPFVALNVASEEDKFSTTEDSDKTEAIPESHSLTTPQSSEYTNPVCSSHINSSGSKENRKTVRRTLTNFFRRKYVIICLIILLFAVPLSLIIHYGFLKNSVHYNPQPSAPSPSGWTEQPSRPFPESTTPRTAPSVYNVTSQPVETGFNLQTLSPHETKVQHIVFYRVSCEVGNKWTDVARRLCVRESYIDQIQAQTHLNIQEKALKVFYKFAKDTDLKYWRRTFMKALEDARRRDLRELVEDIVSRE